KRILLNNIYGVDIDPQAVEVTKLSLLLKVLEGEDEQTIAQQFALFRARVLPDLANNIKCGNSLIGPDFYEGKQMTLLNEEEMYRINAFDWNAEFPEIINPLNPPLDKGNPPIPPLEKGGKGGFDAVIGNPPYIRIQGMKEWAPLEVDHYKKAYKAASKGNYDIYVVFVEKGLSLLNGQGVLGFILPHKFFNAKYGESLRSLLAEGKHLREIIHFGDQQVFANATTYTCLLFLSKQGSDRFHFVKVHDLSTWQCEGSQLEGNVSTDKVTNGDWNFVVGPEGKLFDRLSEIPKKLSDITHLFVGLQTDADDVYILEEVQIKGKQVLCKSKATGKVHPFENSHLKRFVKGSVNIRRYFLSDLTKRLIFPYETIDGQSVLISTSDYEERFPLTWAYLKENKPRLAARNKGKMSGPKWYGYVYRKNHTRLDSSKLLVPSLAAGATFAADIDGEFFFVGSGGGGGGGYGIALLPDTDISYFYLLGLLNSQLSSLFLRAISTPFRGGYIALNRQYIEQLPIRPIDFSAPSDKAHHDRMVGLVKRMLDLQKQLAEAKVPQAKIVLQRQIEATDRQIDHLVYELYGLTDEEIKIVEKGLE
ncbi:MAG: Eco57I restriction-modification methylase domain-containing protein, partial [Deltaproteobacteria bacterium]|nr:Eco57I restriction-modification methylase domain-containing protein [Deltaproteobacteria bacterium]